MNLSSFMQFQISINFDLNIESTIKNPNGNRLEEMKIILNPATPEKEIVVMGTYKVYGDQMDMESIIMYTTDKSNYKPRTRTKQNVKLFGTPVTTTPPWTVVGGQLSIPLLCNCCCCCWYMACCCVVALTGIICVVIILVRFFFGGNVKGSLSWFSLVFNRLLDEFVVFCSTATISVLPFIAGTLLTAQLLLLPFFACIQLSISGKIFSNFCGNCPLVVSYILRFCPGAMPLLMPPAAAVPLPLIWPPFVVASSQHFSVII
ncbi:hypothetical protein FF38_13544 [Lucilia cuprina]|uniref:Uncharacterized protein n=1 Tax=Lucilia cuprina TaxID=7375 RepID=A0A0L0BPT4_LUCCU|nr:hypothetical protein FF38_13544 [Lucilia cuprina]